MKESKIRISGISEAMETVSRKPMQNACGKREKRKTYIKRQALAGIFRLVPVNSDQGFAILEQRRLQTDDDELHAGTSVIADVVCNPCNIGVVKGRIYFIQNEEWRRLVGVYGKEKGESSHGLLSSREMLHIPEALQRRHGVVLDSGKVGLIRVLDIEISV